jgi:hypothetical protein
VLAPAAAMVVLALVALVIAGLSHITVRTASAGAPNQFAITTLRAGQSVCEGPLTSQATTRGVAIWGSAAGGPAQTSVTVKDASTQAVIASGSLRAVASKGEWTVGLNHDVPAGRPVQVCLAQDSGGFALEGSGSSDSQVSQTGVPGGARFSLVLLGAHDRSLLGSLGLAFSRASLWRFGWVGAWTYWVLAVAVLMTFAVAVVAVVRAAADDEAPSERGEDRPQPVA